MEYSVEQILLQARRQTDNEDPTETTGIATEELLYYLNEAQDRLQSLITSRHAHVFDTTSTTSIVANTREYDIPDDAFIDNRIEMLEWTYSGQNRHYRVIPKLRREELSNARGSAVLGFDVRNGKILTSPIVTTAKGTLRITYQRRLDNLDIRRGTVDSTTDDGTNYLTLTLSDDSILSDPENANSGLLEDGQFLCVNSSTGTVNYYNLEYASYDTGTRVFTLASGQALATGTITAGDFITLGKYTTTFSDLTDVSMRYLLSYVVWNILRRESSNDAAEQLQELSGISNDIIETYGTVQDAIGTIPVTDIFFGV